MGGCIFAYENCNKKVLQSKLAKYVYIILNNFLWLTLWNATLGMESNRIQHKTSLITLDFSALCRDTVINKLKCKLLVEKLLKPFFFEMLSYLDRIRGDRGGGVLFGVYFEETGLIEVHAHGLSCFCLQSMFITIIKIRIHISS